MAHAQDIDALYDGFCAALPVALEPVARTLALRLGLVPVAGVPWSQVFGHAVTLGAPALLSEALPRAAPSQVRWAALAHLLAVIEAFGSDRLADGQVPATAELECLLGELRSARDRALALLDPSAGFAAGDERFRRAMAEERALLGATRAASFERYLELSLGKQAAGFPACLALARAAGWRGRELAVLERLLACVWLGLQYHDDVVDWEDDWRKNGAWAVSLALGRRRYEPDEAATEPDVVRAFVLRSGVLADLLGSARRRYRGAWRRARALGAPELARWAEEQEARLELLEDKERISAGYVVRAQKLAPFRDWVLA